jgi:2-isopropylmalate synthase
MELATVGSDKLERFGVGLDTNIVTASIKALVSGVNRLGVSVQAPAAALAA